MVGIVLLTHGDLGQSLIDAVELIAGKQQRVAAAGLKHGDGVREFEKKCASIIDEMDEGNGVLVFVDFVGGTPANTALRCMKEKVFPCVAGVNMPMLLEASTSREDGITPWELEKTCLDVGARSLIPLESFFREKSLMEEITGEEF